MSLITHVCEVTRLTADSTANHAGKLSLRILPKLTILLLSDQTPCRGRHQTSDCERWFVQRGHIVWCRGHEVRDPFWQWH